MNAKDDKAARAKTEIALSGEEALTLYRQGRDKWNEWAKSHPNAPICFSGMTFDESMNFSGFNFPGDIDFKNTRFLKAADFSSARFTKNTRFSDAQFSEYSSFSKARFSADSNFSNAQFLGDSLFLDTQFLERAYFSKTQFYKESWFLGARFLGKAHFLNTRFSGLANFSNAQFSGSTSFKRSTFEGSCSFLNTHFLSECLSPVFNAAAFRSTLTLDSSHFARVPDFRSTTISISASLYNMTIDYRSTGMLWRKRALQKDDAEKYHRLKNLALSARDHQTAGMLYAYELRAQRHHQTHGINLTLNTLYKAVSHYGRNWALPMLWAAVLWPTFAIAYLQTSTLPYSNIAIKQSLLLSASQLIPFLDTAQSARSNATDILFMDGTLPNAFFTLCFIENFLGLALIVLTALALRNRFK